MEQPWPIPEPIMAVVKKRGGYMNRITFGEKVIASAGYDAQKAIMELEFTQTGEVRRFEGVSEEVWYGLKNSYYADRYFQRSIRGQYEESI